MIILSLLLSPNKRYVSQCSKWLPNNIILLQSYDAHFYSSSKSISKEGSLPSFFTYNSGRARRKRKLRLLQWERRKKIEGESIYHMENDTDVIDDKRTIMDIIFPNPFKGIPPPDYKPLPNTFAKWKVALSLTWRDYKETWVGFNTSKGIFIQDDDDNDDNKKKQTEKERLDTINDKKNDVMRNIKRNRRFLQTGAMKLRDEVRTRSGITSMEDVKQYAADAMRLATECLQQFMSGYRKGRDDEVEKMLTQYFQQLEQTARQQAEKEPRRKIKRRILNRYHPMN